MPQIKVGAGQGIDITQVGDGRVDSFNLLQPMGVNASFCARYKGNDLGSWCVSAGVPFSGTDANSIETYNPVIGNFTYVYVKTASNPVLVNW